MNSKRILATKSLPLSVAYQYYTMERGVSGKFLIAE